MLFNTLHLRLKVLLTVNIFEHLPLYQNELAKALKLHAT